MGKSCFSKAIKFFVIALLAAATAITAIAVLSSPAAARTGGRGNLDALKEWDTDNLAASGVSARNYRIPFHDYSGERDRVTAKPCVKYATYDPIGNLTDATVTAGNFNGVCPTGYSLMRWVCRYSYFKYVEGESVSTTFHRTVYLDWVGTRRCRSETVADSYYTPCTFYAGDGFTCLTVGTARAGSQRLTGGLITVPSDLKFCGSVRSDRLYTQCPPNLTEVTASRLAHPGCQSAVADAFFQTGGDTGAVNDFPVASYGSEGEAGTVAATGSRDRGCVEFARQSEAVNTG